jgi:hypothetical protein
MVKRRFVDKCPDNGQPVRIPLADGSHVTRAFVRFGLDDNPSMTENDPAYKSRLMLLPELDRAQILGGDWSAGGSTYYGELNESVHFVKPFKVPDFWHRFGGHDWGYAHPWASCDVVKNERGEIFVMDTVWGHRQQDEDIAARMLERFPHAARPDYVIRCGGDVFSEHQAKRGDQTYSTKDTYRAAGLTIMRKDDSAGSRKRNAVNLRRLIAYRERGRTRDGRPCDGVPLLRFVDTPGNWWLFNQLLNIVKDPTDNELPLKVDWDDGVDVWPESHDEAPAGDDGADALTAALSLALPTVTVPDNAYGRHEDKAEPMGKRIERRRQEHQAGPVVMLPPPSIASGWDADTYEEIRA